MLMATLLASEGKPAFIGCLEVRQNCFPDECQKTCENNLGKDTLGQCQRDHGELKPYPGLECCCFRKDVPPNDKHGV
ncbi:hypothetical protein ZWY2020_045667 [Hordeum vulgare]|nr:hypothetical protein ZWY2020_045667 [Hordeum vulgare]